MKINKKNILSSFITYDQRTQDMLENIVIQLIRQEKEPNDYALVLLQMIAIQFEIYFKAYDSLENQSLTNINIVGDREIHQCKPQVDVLMKASTQISKLLKDLALSPLEAAKVKKLNSAEENTIASGESILASLGIALS